MPYKAKKLAPHCKYKTAQDRFEQNPLQTDDHATTWNWKNKTMECYQQNKSGKEIKHVIIQPTINNTNMQTNTIALRYMLDNLAAITYVQGK